MATTQVEHKNLQTFVTPHLTDNQSKFSGYKIYNTNEKTMFCRLQREQGNTKQEEFHLNALLIRIQVTLFQLCLDISLQIGLRHYFQISNASFVQTYLLMV